jgi:excisionase family DNA binding protein
MTWDPTCRLLTIEEAAESAQRPTSTLRRWVSEGRLAPYARLGRRSLFLESDVLRVDGDTRRGRPTGVGPT